MYNTTLLDVIDGQTSAYDMIWNKEHGYDDEPEKPEEKKRFTYFSPYRPLFIGCYPKSDDLVEVVNYDEKTYIESIDRYVWGYVTYESPREDFENYELIKEK